MTSGHILATTGRAFVAAGLALVATLLLAGAARGDTAQVSVVLPNGTERSLALATLAGSEDVRDRAYLLRGGGGETTRTVTGFSLEKLVEAAGGDPFTITYVEAQRPDGGSVRMSREMAFDESAFPDGPPVVYATANGTGFLRPSAGSSDLNADDSFEAPQGITIVLGKGELLEVEARASTLRTKPGEPVDFSAVVSGAGAGEELVYSWTFDDGGSADGPKATHSFAKPGSYKVVLGVRPPGGTGASDVVRVQVGKPAGGPDRQGGGNNERKNAPDHGAAAGPATGTGSGGSPGTPYEPAGAEAESTAAPAPEEQAPVAEPAPEPDGEEVSGELLTASSAPVEPKRDQQAETRTGSLRGGSGGGMPAAAWGGLATLGLLGLGGLLEARGLGPLLPGRRHGGLG